jgi:hypothetical protein
MSLPSSSGVCGPDPLLHCRLFFGIAILVYRSAIFGRMGLSSE